MVFCVVGEITLELNDSQDPPGLPQCHRPGEKGKVGEQWLQRAIHQSSTAFIK